MAYRLLTIIFSVPRVTQFIPSAYNCFFFLYFLFYNNIITFFFFFPLRLSMCIATRGKPVRLYGTVYIRYIQGYKTRMKINKKKKKKIQRNRLLHGNNNNNWRLKCFSSFLSLSLFLRRVTQETFLRRQKKKKKPL